MIETIMCHDMYEKYPYKMEDIRETVNELILYEDASQGGYSFKEKEALAKLNLKFMMMQ